MRCHYSLLLRPPKELKVAFMMKRTSPYWTNQSLTRRGGEAAIRAHDRMPMPTVLHSCEDSINCMKPRNFVDFSSAKVKGFPWRELLPIGSNPWEEMNQQWWYLGLIIPSWSCPHLRYLFICWEKKQLNLKLGQGWRWYLITVCLQASLSPPITRTLVSILIFTLYP